MPNVNGRLSKLEEAYLPTPPDYWQQSALDQVHATFGEEGVLALTPLIMARGWATVRQFAYILQIGIPPRELERELAAKEQNWQEQHRRASAPLVRYVRAWLETPAGQTRLIDDAYAWRSLYDGTLGHTETQTQQALALAWQQTTGAEPEADDWWRAVVLLAYGREGGWTPQDPPARETLGAVGDCGHDVIREWLHWATGVGCRARYAPGPMPDAPTPAETWAEELAEVLARWEEDA